MDIKVEVENYGPVKTWRDTEWDEDGEPTDGEKVTYTVRRFTATVGGREMEQWSKVDPIFLPDDIEKAHAHCLGEFIDRCRKAMATKP